MKPSSLDMLIQYIKCVIRVLLL